MTTSTTTTEASPARDFLIAVARTHSTPSPSAVAAAAVSSSKPSSAATLLVPLTPTAETTATNNTFSSEETEYMSTVISEALNRLIAISTDAAAAVSSTTREMPAVFDTVNCTPPPLNWYVGRWIKYSRCSAQAYGVALHYIDELFKQGRFLMTERNIYKVFAVAVIEATKMLEDRTYSNGYYAHIAGVTVDTLFELELQFLALFGFSINPSWHAVSPYISAIETLVSSSSSTTSSSVSTTTTTTPTPLTE